jgi:hypothetical protein
VSIPPASQVHPVQDAIGPTTSPGTRSEFLMLGPTNRASIISWYHGWPGKQAGGEKGVSGGATPADKMNRIHPRL